MNKTDSTTIKASAPAEASAQWNTPTEAQAQHSSRILNSAVDYIRSLKCTGPGYADKVQGAVDSAQRLADVMSRLLSSRLFSIDHEVNRMPGTEQTALRDLMIESLTQWEQAQ